MKLVCLATPYTTGVCNLGKMWRMEIMSRMQPDPYRRRNRGIHQGGLANRCVLLKGLEFSSSLLEYQSPANKKRKRQSIITSLNTTCELEIEDFSTVNAECNRSFVRYQPASRQSTASTPHGYRKTPFVSDALLH